MHGAPELQRVGVLGVDFERVRSERQSLINPRARVRGIAIDPRLAVRHRGTKHYWLGPLRIRSLGFGRERVGELERARCSRETVSGEQYVGVFARFLRPLEQGPRRHAAGAGLCLPQPHLLSQPLAQELCDPGRQAVPNRQHTPHRLLEARPLEVRPAGAVDQTYRDMVAVLYLLHTTLHLTPDG